MYCGVIIAGCGKTELCKRFETEGFRTLDEAFLDMPSYGIHPQSLLMETTWVVSWFERLLKQAESFKARGESHERVVFFADRSPFSAVFYSNHGELLKPIIEKQIEEVREFANIYIHSVHVRVEREVLWKRVQARLELEPDRAIYKEDKREWMEQVVSFYENFSWDTEIDNTEDDVTMSLQNLLSRTVRTICTSLPNLDVCLQDAAPKLYKRSQETFLNRRPNSETDSEGYVDEDFCASIPVDTSSRVGSSRRIQAPQFVSP